MRSMTKFLILLSVCDLRRVRFPVRVDPGRVSLGLDNLYDDWHVAMVFTAKLRALTAIHAHLGPVSYTHLTLPTIQL